MLAAVDVDGNIYMSAASERNIREARKAGYTARPMHVPLSGHDDVTDSLRVRERLREAFKQLDKKEMDLLKERHDVFRSVTQQTGTETLLEHWVQADGVPYRAGSGKELAYPSYTDFSPEQQTNLLRRVGTYSVDRSAGLVAACDAEGRTLVAVLGTGREVDLVRCGFVEGNFDVPFTGDSEILDDYTSAALESSRVNRLIPGLPREADEPARTLSLSS
jgi:hypothetical protein